MRNHLAPDSANVHCLASGSAGWLTLAPVIPNLVALGRGYGPSALLHLSTMEPRLHSFHIESA